MARHALLISTDTYQDATLRQLRSPRADAETLAQVLGDPDIADFSVQTLHNVPSHAARLELNELFEGRRSEDLLVVYFSCHGVKDDRARLYFAFTDTLHQRLPATAISADYVSELMEASPARRIVLLLDCCFSGAFSRGMRTRAGGGVDVLERFTGRGRAVITATNAMEYAFELEQDVIIDADPTPTPSIFTSALIRGLATGEADRGGDGLISVDELYDYVYDQVRAQTQKQTPSRWFDVEGSLVLARVHTPLPEALHQQLGDPLPANRLRAIGELGRLAVEASPVLAEAARRTLERLTQDDSRSVSAEASGVLAALPGPEAPRQPPRRRRPRRRTLVLGVLAATLVTLAVVIGLALNLRSEDHYWIGFSGDNVAVFRGAIGDVSRSTLVERTLIRRPDVSGQESRLLDGIKAQGLEDARQTANCSPLSLPKMCLFGVTAASAPPENSGTPFQSGRRIFQDDFTSRKNNWSLEDGEIAKKQYLNGTYRILVKKPEYAPFGTPEILEEELSSLRDVGIVVQAGKLAGGDNNQYGIICRYRDADNYYAVHISSDGHYAFEKRQQGKWVTLKDGPTDAVRSDVMNSLSVTCTGGSRAGPVELALWLNGRRLGEVIDRTGGIASGGVGLLASSFSGSTDVVFDNIEVFNV